MMWLVNLVIGWGVPAKAGKVVAFTLLALFIVLALWSGKCAYDAAVIDKHDTKIELEQSKADRKADANLADQTQSDTQREAQEASQLQKAVDNAPNDPKIDDRVERNLALHRCLRLQQAARENGLKPPTCV